MKTLVQGAWDEAFVYRASRGAPHQGRPHPGESFYCRLDDRSGTPRPAALAWELFDRMARTTGERLSARCDAPTPTVLAGRAAGGRALQVLLAHWKPLPTGPDQQAYDITVEGFSPGARLTATRTVIGARTRALEAEPAVPLTAGAAGAVHLTGHM